MSQRIKRQGSMLTMLSKCKPQVAKAVIKAADKDLLDALCECSLNVLRGSVPLSPRQRQRLVKYKTTLRSLAKKGVSAKKKKALLQKGGFLGALLGPVIGVLGSLFNKL